MNKELDDLRIKLRHSVPSRIITTADPDYYYVLILGSYVLLPQKSAEYYFPGYFES